MLRWTPPLAILLGACVVSPDPALWRREAAPDLPDGAAPDRDLVARDGSGEAPADQLSPDTAPGKLTCTPPALAGTNSPYPLYEVALHTDGLELVAKESGQWYSTTRAAQDQPFGDWATSTLLSGKQDPTFFAIKGIEIAIVAKSPGSGLPRFLELCTSPSTCSQMTLTDKQTNQVVTDDTDGPSVAVLPSGDLLMAHNIGPGGSGDGHVYLAVPSDANDLSKPWVTEAVAAMDRAGSSEDDPAISPDGLVIVVDGASSSGDSDLWVSQRGDLASPFPAQVPLADVNSSADDASAYIAPLPSSAGKNGFELFFSSDRDGNLVIYRSECSR